MSRLARSVRADHRCARSSGTRRQDAGGIAGNGRAVGVTGASTGIGRKITEHLAVGRIIRLRRRIASRPISTRSVHIKIVQAVKLDVTRQDDIDAADRRTITKRRSRALRESSTTPV